MEDVLVSWGTFRMRETKEMSSFSFWTSMSTWRKYLCRDVLIVVLAVCAEVISNWEKTRWTHWGTVWYEEVTDDQNKP